ncbi:MAG: malto-oligosyltrehalose synthase [Dehalococcoidia bacterium]|nr:malto-oligosyltrehalose synthase [Dehalococcoidia bacterium]
MTDAWPGRYGTPLGTYRLQLHRGFGFAEARAAAGYLARLGVSHLYLSPVFTATPGSEHGYDVVDHSQINPELGGLAGLYELGETLAREGMGLVLDIVPNHVGVGGRNPWWWDVLRYGRASRYAGYFDIDWEAQPQMESGVLVLPMLGKPFGVTLEAGELSLAIEENDLAVRYFENRFPLAPESYAAVASLPPLELRDELNDPAAFASLVEVLDGLARGDAERTPALLDRWREILASEPAIRAQLEEQLAAINGRPGDPASFDRLEEILRQQHYRLADWRVSGEELNYRRFFDINSLAGIRVEREDVFEEVHALVFQLVARGIVTGVRVDHIDGLYDPASYLARLRHRLDEASGEAGGGHVPIYVEKILEGDEALPGHWPVDGTTGYELAARVDGLLVDEEGRRGLDETYRQFLGRTTRYQRVAYEARLEVAESAFAGEVNLLALQLHRIAQRHRRHRDNTLRSLREALTVLLASFPVYRTYLDPAGDDQSDRFLRQALETARRRAPLVSEDALDFLAEVLLLEGDLEEEERARREHFRRRFQQLSGPVMAKGQEDTTFYRYNRLISLNEVGSDPARFGMPPADVHAWLEARARDWSGAMLAGSTHDTKRSASVRARIHVLSEVPDVWRTEVFAWRGLNDRLRGTVDGEPAPSANAEYYLYQTLVGSWPEGGLDNDYRGRLRTHFIKAMREAKAETSWLRPNEAYEEAALAFLDGILDPWESAELLARIEAFVTRVRPAGILNAVSGLVVRALAPGFPDVYQGTERWRFSLTDPDNRRPVDFAAAEALLGCSGPGPAPDLASDAGRQWLVRTLLRIRAEWREALTGEYRGLQVEGRRADRVFAFARSGRGGTLVAIVPRRTVPLLDEAGRVAAEAWEDTRVALPVGEGWHDLASGGQLEPGDTIACREALARLPFALLGRREGDGG